MEKISTLKKKLLGSSKSRSGEDDTPALSIGTPTNVKRLHHAEVSGDSITGLPPDLQKMLQAMTTAEERQVPGNKDKARNVLMWMKREEEKRDQQNFIRGDFMQIGSSGESSSSLDRSSGEDQGSSKSNSTFYIEKPKQPAAGTAADEANNATGEQVTFSVDETTSTTLRRSTTTSRRPPILTSRLP